jgi:antitoxin component of MazEF toxin-antitoxin module
MARMKLLKIGTSYGVVIPRPLLEELRFMPGDSLSVKVDRGALKVTSEVQRNVGIRSKAAKPAQR